MHRSRALFCLSAAAAFAAGLAGLAGCPSTAATSLYTPITGFIIDSQTLTAGLGCGTGAGQVYKYAAVVTLPDRTLVSGVFDCFTNAQFANLPTPDGGTTDYPVAVYAFDQSAFPAQQLGPCADLGADAACPGEDPRTVLAYAKAATWTATCTATEIQGMSQVALCTALQAQGTVGEAGAGEAGDAGEAGSAVGQPAVLVETQGFVGADGGTLRCTRDFDRVRASFVSGVQVGTPPQVACPSPIVIAPAVADAGYTITTTLLRGDASVATASCQAIAAGGAGAQVLASCGPAGP